MLKKRGNRTHKKKTHRLQNAKSAAALRSRDLRADAGARVYTGMRALCVSSPLSCFLLPLLFPFTFCVLVLCDTHARWYTYNAPARPRVPRSLMLLYLRVRCTTDAGKARIKLSRWFAVCIAWRRRVMRAGVRIYGRHGCSRNADRWNVKVLLPFFFPARYARGKKFNLPRRER